MTTLFIRLVNMAMAAGWVIFAVAVLRLLLRKSPKWISCLLWSLAAIRLLCPFSVESIFSLLPSSEVVNPSILYAPAPEIHTGISVVNHAVNPILSESLAPIPENSANPAQILAFSGSVIWMIGLGIILLYGMVSLWLLHRRVAAALQVEPGIWICDQVDTPFLLGFFRPRIYLPSDLPEEQKIWAIAHERAHLHRKDHWWKLLAFLLLAVYWFQPLVWLGYMLFCRDLELACDERVVGKSDIKEKQAYAHALLACSLPRHLSVCPLAFGEVGVRARIGRVLHYRKPALWVSMAALMVAVLAAVCLLTNPLSSTLQTGRYLTVDRLYLTPSSSLLFPPLDNSLDITPIGVTLTIGKEAPLTIEPVTWRWQEMPYSPEEWENLTFNSSVQPDWENCRYQELSERYFLLQTGEELWLVDIYHHSPMPSEIQSILLLVPETEVSQLTWNWTPAISSIYPAFQMNFPPELTVSASCTGGTLKAPTDLYHEGTALTLPSESGLYWAPWDGQSATCWDANVTITLSDDKGPVASGTLYFQGEPDDVFPVRYTVRFVSSSMVMTAPEEGWQADFSIRMEE